MAAVDTNVLIRLLIEDDENQGRHAEAFVRTAGRVFVSLVVLVEASWVLSSVYELSRDELGTTIDLLLAGDAFVVEKPELAAEALRLYRASHAQFADCVIVASAQAANELPLATFDEAASRLPGARRLGGKRVRKR